MFVPPFPCLSLILTLNPYRKSEKMGCGSNLIKTYSPPEMPSNSHLMFWASPLYIKLASEAAPATPDVYRDLLLRPQTKRQHLELTFLTSSPESLKPQFFQPSSTPASFKPQPLLPSTSLKASKPSKPQLLQAASILPTLTPQLPQTPTPGSLKPQSFLQTSTLPPNLNS